LEREPDRSPTPSAKVKNEWSITFTPLYASVTGEDGGSVVLRNFGTVPHHYMASQTRRPRPESILGPLVYIILNSASPNIVKVIKSRGIKWEDHVERMGEMRNSYEILVGNLEGKRSL
jgi:hypothetical protein